MVGAADDTRSVLGRAAMTPLLLLMVMASDQDGLLDRPRLFDKHSPLYLYFASLSRRHALNREDLIQAREHYGWRVDASRDCTPDHRARDDVLKRKRAKTSNVGNFEHRYLKANGDETVTCRDRSI